MSKTKYLNYIAVVLVVIFLVSAGLVVLSFWEKDQSDFGDAVIDDGTVIYEGKEYVRRDGLETFLVLGIDRELGEKPEKTKGANANADFLMLFVIDNENKKFSAIEINRDTMAGVNRLSIGGTSVIETYTAQIAISYGLVDGDNDKIRCRNTKDSVEALLHGIKVDRYMALTMDSVATLNDFVGGVEVTVLDDFTGIDDSLVKGELVTLRGEQALRYVRTRQGLEDPSNTNRMERQRQYVDALYEKLKTKATDSSFMVQLVEELDDYIVYNSTDNQMKKLAEKISEYEFLGVKKIEGESRVGEEYVEFYPDEDALWALIYDTFYVQKTAK